MKSPSKKGFYQQEYCGCVYSLRDTNLWRSQNNRTRIEKGTQFYKFKKNDHSKANQNS